MIAAAGTIAPRTARCADGALAQLAAPRRPQIMRTLAVQAASTAQLAQLVEISDRRARAHVHELEKLRAVERVHLAGRAHRVGWRLTAAGRELIALHELIGDCERRLGLTGADDSEARLLATLRFLNARMVIWALAGGSLSLADLERQLPEVPHTTLQHALERLGEAGVIDAHENGGGRVFQLARCARGPIALIVTAGVRWRLRFAPERPPFVAGNLTGLIGLLAPALRVRSAVQGVCVMQSTADQDRPANGRPRRWPDARLSVLRGRLSPLPPGFTERPQARMRAEDLCWCEALVGGDASKIDVDGDRELAGAVLGAITAALRG